MESKSEKFEVRGINHMALVCSDMERTVAFYNGVLGLPVVKTRRLPNGGQHVTFQISERSGIAFYASPDAPPAAPGIATQGWSGYDDASGQMKRVRGHGMSAYGSAHHIAFDIPLERQEEYKEKLRAAGVPVTEVNHHILYDKDKQAAYPWQVPDDAEAIDEFVNSIYFPDPDGIMLEFAAWIRPLTPDDVTHMPARAHEVEAVPARLPAREQAAARG